MIRTIFRDNRMLFGPIRDSDLAVISKDPVFEGHGISATAAPGQVDVFVSMPADAVRAQRLQRWFLQNHRMLSPAVSAG
jgi:hypothetical protein